MKVCLVEGCPREQYGRKEYCLMHHTRNRRYGNPGLAEPLVRKKEKHAMANSKEYGIWSSMKQRCYLTTCKRYSAYGVKGIEVCDRWRYSFVNFLEDMGPRPSSKHSIERIDNDGDYCIENCKWATMKEQSRNKSSNRLLSYKGETKTVVEWAEDKQLPANTLYRRLYRGWSTEKTLETAHKGLGFPKGFNHY